MTKLLAFIAAFSFCLMPTVADASSVTMPFYSLTIDKDGNVSVLTAAPADQTQAAVISPAAVSPQATVPPSSCGSMPPGTHVMAPENGIFYDLHGDTASFKFTVRPGNTVYSASYSSTNPVQKIVWVSSCPGAVTTSGVPDPVNSSFYAQNYQTAGVMVSGTSSQTPNMLWDQLTIDKTYYFNVRNATQAAPTKSTCPGDCPFVLGWPNN